MISVFCKDNVDLCLDADWPLILDRGGIGVSPAPMAVVEQGEEGYTEEAEREVVCRQTKDSANRNRINPDYLVCFVVGL
jgi:hypothetical protein